MVLSRVHRWPTSALQPSEGAGLQGHETARASRLMAGGSWCCLTCTFVSWGTAARRFSPAFHQRHLAHPVSPDYSSGFGGKYGVQSDRVDKSAVGFDYQGETEKHGSQRGGRAGGRCAPR